MSSSSSSSTLSAPGQDRFYAVAERARDERLRVRRGEFRSRAEVVAAFRRRVDELMNEFAEALATVDDVERFGAGGGGGGGGGGASGVLNARHGKKGTTNLHVHYNGLCFFFSFLSGLNSRSVDTFVIYSYSFLFFSFSFST